MQAKVQAGILLVLLVGVFSISKCDVNESGGAIYVQGKFGINDISAAATFELPILVPPGSNNMQPSFKLTMSSANFQRSKTTVGAGWTLEGAPSIQRCPNNLQENGFSSSITYTEVDRFCMGPVQLLNISGIYGADGTEYTTRMEQYFKIISHGGSVSTGPSWFEIWLKEGTIGFLGNTPDSFIGVSNRPGVARVWALSSVFDRAGNYMNISYSSDVNTGSYAITQANYTGNSKMNILPFNSVNFVYESRPDIVQTYVAGSPLSTPIRLSSIQTFNGSSGVLEYSLSYQQSRCTGASYITEITVCSLCDQMCFNSTIFQMTERCSSPFSTSLSTNISSPISSIYSSAEISLSSYISGDFDGNGLTDILYIPNGEPIQLNFRYFNDTTKRTISGPTLFPKTSSENILSTYLLSIKPVDFNADGKLDLYVIQGVGSNSPTNVSDVIYLSNGDGTFSSISGPQTYMTSGFTPATQFNLGRVRFGDFNADSIIDVFVLFGGFGYPAGSSNISAIYINNNDGTYEYWPGVPFSISNSEDLANVDKNRISLLDINADGYTDIYEITGWGNSPADNVYINTHNANGEFELQPGVQTFIPSNINGALIQLQRIRFIDYNGDGATDYYYINGTGSSPDTIIPNLGNGTLSPANQLSGMITSVSLLSDEAALLDLRSIQFTDANSDGYDDCIIFTIDSSPSSLMIGQGNGSFLTIPGPSLPSFGASFSSMNLNLQRIRLVEWNGDGQIDVYWINGGAYTSDPTYTIDSIYFNSNVQLAPIKIINGIGSEISLEYRSMTDDIVYKRGNMDLKYPLTYIQTTWMLLYRTSQSDASGGFKNSTYFYIGAKQQLRGLGFMGFENVTVFDDSTGIAVTTIYSSDFSRYLQFRALEQIQKSSTGTILSQTVNHWVSKQINRAESVYGGDGGGGDSENNSTSISYFPFVQLSWTASWDLNGSPFGNITISTNYDDWGNPIQTSQKVIDSTGEYSQSTFKKYINDKEQWLLGLSIFQNITSQSLDQPPLSQITISTYYNNTGFLKSQTSQPHSEVWSTLYFDVDNFGNIINITTLGVDIPSTSTLYVYDQKGRWPIQTINALNQSTFSEYDERFGKVIKQVDLNGLSTTYNYNGFALLTSTTNPDNTTSRNVYMWCSNQNGSPFAISCQNTYGVYIVITYNSLNIPEWIVYNNLKQPVRKVSISFNGTQIWTDIKYNPQGQPISNSSPYYYLPSTPMPIYWTSTSYDELGRPIQYISLDNSTTKIEYNGLISTMIDPLGHPFIKIQNSLKQTLQSIEFVNSSTIVTTITYDSLGRKINITDSEGNSIISTYNILGYPTSVFSPDRGMTLMYYDVLGNILNQTNANNITITFKYDNLNRKIQADSEDDISKWIYDISPHGVGKIFSTANSLGYNSTFYYDSLSRPISSLEVIPDSASSSSSFFYSTTYDQYSRPSTFTYPSEITLSMCYNAYGYLYQEVIGSSCSSGTVLRTIKQQDQNGNIILQQFVNGLSTQRGYNYTNHLISIQTGSNSDFNNIQNLEYMWNVIGSLQQRSDLNRNLHEIFKYDELQRLLSASVIDQQPQTYFYDNTGNILYKSDYGSYQYGQNGAGPHAVTTVRSPIYGNIEFTYDDVGNLLAGGNRTVHYNSRNMPDFIENVGSKQTSWFFYSPNNHRFLQIIQSSNYYNHGSSNNDTTMIISVANGLYNELRDENGEISEQRHYFGSWGIFTIFNDSKTSNSLNIIHRDHLGSIDVITDIDGNIIDQQSYDAFGLRRNASSWAPFTSYQLDNYDSLGEITNFGFEGHEQLYGFNLIYAGSRLYDPLLGRFWAADNVIQNVMQSQSLNLYSYVNNNPLTHVDPSGHGFIHNLFHDIENLFKGIEHAIEDVVHFIQNSVIARVVLNIAIDIICLPCSEAINLSNAMWHIAKDAFDIFVEGGSWKMIFADEVLEGGMSAAGSVFDSKGRLSSHPLSLMEDSAMHGIVGGIASEIVGGKFTSGFAAGVTSGLVGGLIGPSGGGFLMRTEGLLASGISGALASKLTGGSMLYGLKIGIVGYARNDDAASTSSKESGSSTIEKIHEDLERLSKAIGGAKLAFKAIKLPLTNEISLTAESLYENSLEVITYLSNSEVLEISSSLIIEGATFEVSLPILIILTGAPYFEEYGKVMENYYDHGVALNFPLI